MDRLGRPSITMPLVRRAFRLGRPGPQLRLLLSYVTISALALLLQYLLFSRGLAQVARSLPSDAELLIAQTDRMLLTLLLGSFVVLLPITFLVGIAASSRWAGPLLRMERFLSAIARGEAPADLRLRRSDELRELAQLLNHVTEPLRRTDATAQGDAADEPPERRAA